MSDLFDPEDPNQRNSDIKIPLFWILLPVALVFIGIIGMTLYHLKNLDYLRP
ncbi:MAG: hypothetical protein VST70_02780 [Nitrospirota bacterium]|nr:hypothetical protein [Nitrospirota bacterium]